MRVLAAQVRSPLLLILVFAAVVSAFTGEWVDALIVLLIVVASVGVSYSREYSAQMMVTVCAITGLYVLAAEGAKHWFFRSAGFATVA